MTTRAFDCEGVEVDQESDRLSYLKQWDSSSDLPLESLFQRAAVVAENIVLHYVNQKRYDIDTARVIEFLSLSISALPELSRVRMNDVIHSVSQSHPSCAPVLAEFILAQLVQLQLPRIDQLNNSLYEICDERLCLIDEYISVLTTLVTSSSSVALWNNFLRKLQVLTVSVFQSSPTLLGLRLFILSRLAGTFMYDLSGFSDQLVSLLVSMIDGATATPTCPHLSLDTPYFEESVHKFLIECAQKESQKQQFVRSRYGQSNHDTHKPSKLLMATASYWNETVMGQFREVQLSNEAKRSLIRTPKGRLASIVTAMRQWNHTCRNAQNNVVHSLLDSLLVHGNRVSCNHHYAAQSSSTAQLAIGLLERKILSWTESAESIFSLVEGDEQSTSYRAVAPTLLSVLVLTKSVGGSSLHEGNEPHMYPMNAVLDALVANVESDGKVSLKASVLVLEITSFFLAHAGVLMLSDNHVVSLASRVFIATTRLLTITSTNETDNIDELEDFRDKKSRKKSSRSKKTRLRTRDRQRLHAAMCYLIVHRAYLSMLNHHEPLSEAFTAFWQVVSSSETSRAEFMISLPTSLRVYFLCFTLPSLHMNEALTEDNEESADAMLTLEPGELLLTSEELKRCQARSSHLALRNWNWVSVLFPSPHPHSHSHSASTVASTGHCSVYSALHGLCAMYLVEWPAMTAAASNTASGVQDEGQGRGVLVSEEAVEEGDVMEDEVENSDTAYDSEEGDCIESVSASDDVNPDTPPPVDEDHDYLNPQYHIKEMNTRTNWPNLHAWRNSDLLALHEHLVVTSSAAADEDTNDQHNALTLKNVDYFSLLPLEMQTHVLSYLSYKRLGRLASLSSSWYQAICHNAPLWEQIYWRSFPHHIFLSEVSIYLSTVSSTANINASNGADANSSHHRVVGNESTAGITPTQAAVGCGSVAHAICHGSSSVLANAVEMERDDCPGCILYAVRHKQLSGGLDSDTGKLLSSSSSSGKIRPCRYRNDMHNWHLRFQVPMSFGYDELSLLFCFDSGYDS